MFIYYEILSLFVLSKCTSKFANAAWCNIIIPTNSTSTIYNKPCVQARSTSYNITNSTTQCLGSLWSTQKSGRKMKLLLVFALVFAIAFSEDAKEEKSEERAKVFKRLIPADVLRDFPGMCFASTRCATVEPGKTWDLTPFCGRSTCVLSEDKPPRLLELVEDCGPLPLANPKCKLDEEKTNKTASFPDCCPHFKCEEGAKLEYPEIPTVAPVKEEATTAATKA